MPVKEAEATNSLIDQGVDVLTCHVDSPKVVVETAEKRGIYRLRLPRQPGHAGAQGLPDRRRVELGHALHRADQGGAERQAACPTSLRGGLKEGFVKMSPYGAGGDATRPRRRPTTIKAAMVKGGFVIFKGPLKDNKGNDVIAAGKSLDQIDVELEKMNYLVEGVIGSIPAEHGAAMSTPSPRRPRPCAPSRVDRGADRSRRALADRCCRPRRRC